MERAGECQVIYVRFFFDQKKLSNSLGKTRKNCLTEDLVGFRLKSTKQRDLAWHLDGKSYNCKNRANAKWLTEKEPLRLLFGTSRDQDD